MKAKMTTSLTLPNEPITTIWLLAWLEMIPSNAEIKFDVASAEDNGPMGGYTPARLRAISATWEQEF